MTRDYGRIRSQFWSDEKVVGWSIAEKGFAAYLLTSEHTTALGCFRLPMAYMCADLGVTATEAAAMVKTLERDGFVTYDSRSGWVWIRKYLSHNVPENANVWKHVRRLANSIPPTVAFRAEVLKQIERPEKTVGEQSGNGSETLSEGKSESHPNLTGTQPNLTQPNPTELSDTDVSGADAPPPIGALLWSVGLQYLKANGVPEKSARGLLGKWRKNHGDGEALNALVQAQNGAVSEPVGWIEQRLRSAINGPRISHGEREARERHDAILEGGLRSIGYRRGEDGIWRDPDGEPVAH